MCNRKDIINASVENIFISNNTEASYVILAQSKAFGCDGKRAGILICILPENTDAICVRF